MGARIEGIGSNVLIVHGRDQLGGADYRIGPDYIEIGSFVALAAVTGGELRIRDTVPGDLRMTRLVFDRLGCQMEFDGDDVVVPPAQRLRVRDDEGDAISKIEDGPWPAFPADLTSIALALATQSEGMVLIFEKMFENRLDRSPPRAAPRWSAARAVFTVSAWRARTSAPGWRCSSRPSAPAASRRSGTSARSTAGTSASTSACSPSAPRSSAFRPSRSRSRPRLRSWRLR